MKIWHISDTHTYHGLLTVPEDIDMVIFSGDCSNPRDPYINEQEVRNFITWFDSLNIEHKIFVAGNHDISIEKGLITKDNFDACGIHYLENTCVTIDGFKIFGSPYTPTFNNWAFNKDKQKLERMWRNVIEDDVDIVVTHGPCKGVLDLTENLDRNLEMCGDKSLLNRLLEVEPLLHLFGHIHNHKDIVNQGVLTRGKTKFSNGSVVKDGHFGQLTSNGNIFEL